MYNKQHYKNVRHQVTRRAQIWLKKLRHLDAIQVLFVSLANESPVYSHCKSPWGLGFLFPLLTKELFSFSFLPISFSYFQSFFLFSRVHATL